eukprot:gene7159-12817_t
MADFTDDDEVIDGDDFYAILNVRKEASSDEIRNAYKRMCTLYHPDKHQGQEKKQVAEKLFNKVGKAYEVLNNPDKRAIYDIYGHKGLLAGWEVVERHRTPQEIQDEYERLRRQKEEQRLLQRTNPKGSISVTINATELFDSYEDQYYDDVERGFPNIEVKGMSIQQSIEAPLTRSDTAVLSGALQVQNGIGTGNVGLTVRRVVSHQAWGEIDVRIGDGPKVQIKGFRHLTKKMYGTVSLVSQFKQNFMSAGLQAMIMRQLGNHTTGYLTWVGGFNSAMTATIDHRIEHHHLNGTLQLGVANTFGILNYQYVPDSDTKVKACVKYGLVFGPILEYGYDHQVTTNSRLAATMIVGPVTGVTMKLKLVRFGQVYSFPVMLSEAVSPSAVFYGSVVPLLAYWSIKVLIINPFKKKEEEEDIQMQREKYARQTAEKRRQAEEAVELMQDVYRRSVETEQNKKGLVILNAWYGQLVTTERSEVDTPKVIDVTVPLQCLVNGSKLILTEASKANLSGFYDPCIGEEKSLKLVYEFRELLHEVVIKDDETLRIPLQCEFKS